MKRLVCLVAVVLAAMVSNALAQASRIPYDGRWYCQTPGDTQTIYYSDVFDVKATKPAVEKAFRESLDSKYGYKDSVSCVPSDKSANKLPTMEVSKEFQKQKIALWRSKGKTVIETGWTYVPGGTSDYDGR